MTALEKAKKLVLEEMIDIVEKNDINQLAFAEIRKEVNKHFDELYCLMERFKNISNEENMNCIYTHSNGANLYEKDEYSPLYTNDPILLGEALAEDLYGSSEQKCKAYDLHFRILKYGLEKI